jgi:hypothetical protein
VQRLRARDAAGVRDLELGHEIGAHPEEGKEILHRAERVAGEIVEEDDLELLAIEAIVKRL